MRIKKIRKLEFRDRVDLRHQPKMVITPKVWDLLVNSRKVTRAKEFGITNQEAACRDQSLTIWTKRYTIKVIPLGNGLELETTDDKCGRDFNNRTWSYVEFK